MSPRLGAAGVFRCRGIDEAGAAFAWLNLCGLMHALELVYVGDAGTTEPNDATERLGFEATMFWQARDAPATSVSS